jgi:hypothetical protein
MHRSIIQSGKPADQNTLIGEYLIYSYHSLTYVNVLNTVGQPNQMINSKIKNITFKINDLANFSTVPA